MAKLKETKQITKVIRELEIFKYKLIQDTNAIILKLEKILKEND